MAISQISVRIDEGLKTKGNLVLERSGHTPSEVIRALWSFFAAHSSEPSIISERIAELEPSPATISQSKVERARKQWEKIQEDIRQLTGGKLVSFSDEDIERLKEEHYMEKYGAGGSL